MAVFNVASAFGQRTKKKGGGSGYGILLDRLSDKETILGADGNLSPGDSSLLIQDYQKLYASAGTASQKSKVLKKITTLEANVNKTQLAKQQDIGVLNKEVNDDKLKTAMLYGNNPQVLLSKREASLRIKVQQLDSAITSLEESGQSAAGHYMEYRNAQIELDNLVRAQGDMFAIANGENIQSDYTAYLTNNNRGEIIGVEIAPRGSLKGYSDLEGVFYGGLTTAGKPRKEGEEQVFNLGNNRFAASNSFSIGPNGQVTLGSDKLTSPDIQGRYDINSETVRNQDIIRSGGYAKGDKGFFYKNNGDGTYTKYLNADAKKLNIDESQVLPIPKDYETAINSQVSDTQDFADTPDIFGAPLGALSFGDPSQGGVSLAAPNQRDVSIDRSATLTQRPRAGTVRSVPNSRPPAAPIDSSPNTSKNIFSRTIDSAKGFLGRVFGG